MMHITRGKLRGRDRDRIVRMLLSCGCILFVLVQGACSRAEPRVTFQSMQLVYYQTDTDPVERLSFFVLPEDPDGPDDLEELRLYHDGEGLMWTFKADDWVRVEDAGQIWIGSYGVAPAEGEHFPSGQYRAMLIDKGGERSDRTFGFTAQETPLYDFPKLTVDHNGWTIECDYPVMQFLCYNAEGRWSNTIDVTSKTGTFTTEMFPRTVRSIALWAQDREHSTSAMTNRVSIR